MTLRLVYVVCGKAWHSLLPVPCRCLESMMDVRIHIDTTLQLCAARRRCDTDEQHSVLRHSAVMLTSLYWYIRLWYVYNWVPGKHVDICCSSQ